MSALLSQPSKTQSKHKKNFDICDLDGSEDLDQYSHRQLIGYASRIIKDTCWGMSGEDFVKGITQTNDADVIDLIEEEKEGVDQQQSSKKQGRKRKTSTTSIPSKKRKKQDPLISFLQSYLSHEALERNSILRYLERFCSRVQQHIFSFLPIIYPCNGILAPTQMTQMNLASCMDISMASNWLSSLLTLIPTHVVITRSYHFLGHNNLTKIETHCTCPHKIITLQKYNEWLAGSPSRCWNRYGDDFIPFPIDESDYTKQVNQTLLDGWSPVPQFCLDNKTVDDSCLVHQKTITDLESIDISIGPFRLHYSYSTGVWTIRNQSGSKGHNFVVYHPPVPLTRDLWLSLLKTVREEMISNHVLRKVDYLDFRYNVNFRIKSEDDGPGSLLRYCLTPDPHMGLPSCLSRFYSFQSQIFVGKKRRLFSPLHFCFSDGDPIYDEQGKIISNEFIVYSSAIHSLKYDQRNMCQKWKPFIRAVNQKEKKRKEAVRQEKWEKKWRKKWQISHK